MHPAWNYSKLRTSGSQVLPGLPPFRLSKFGHDRHHGVSPPATIRPIACDCSSRSAVALRLKEFSRLAPALKNGFALAHAVSRFRFIASRVCRRPFSSRRHRTLLRPDFRSGGPGHFHRAARKRRNPRRLPQPRSFRPRAETAVGRAFCRQGQYRCGGNGYHGGLSRIRICCN